MALRITRYAGTQEEWNELKALMTLPEVANWFNYDVTSLVPPDISDQAASRFLGWYDNKVIGFVFVTKNMSHRLNHVGSISYGIHPDMAGKAFGQALIKHGVDYALSTGLTRIECDIVAENTPSLIAILKCGFSIEGLMQARWRSPSGEHLDMYRAAYLPK